MDKEDCVHLLLSALARPQWKHSSSVSDWDIKNVLWCAGYLLSPEQVDALLADTRRRGLIAGRERRSVSRQSSMWGVRITQAGENWLVQYTLASACAVRSPQLDDAPPAEPGASSNGASHSEEPMRLGLQ